MTGIFDPSGYVTQVETAGPLILPFMGVLLLITLVVGIAWFLIDSFRNK